MLKQIFILITLFASFSSQIAHSEMDKRPKPACAERSGLGFILRVHKLLSSALLVSFGKHTRNTLKDTKVPAVPAIRTGQDPYQAIDRSDPVPDGWET